MTGPATLSLGRVRFLDDGTWRVDPSGAPAVLILVHDRGDVVADVIAYHLDDPSEWWLRYGDSCPLLGARALAMAAYHQDPVTLCSTPERWLIGQRRAPSAPSPVCILDWGVGLGPLFDGVSQVECDSPALHDRLQRALRAWEPEITAPRENLLSTGDSRTVCDAA